MKFDTLIKLFESGSVFKSFKDALKYCQLVRKSGVKCSPKCIDREQNLWQINYK